MKKPNGKSVFVCSNCGNESPTWAGKCSACGEWNSLKEFSPAVEKSSAGAKILLSKLSDFTNKKSFRTQSKYSEIDRVFGGGIVEGAVMLVGGEPGIGKSTLVLQLIEKMAPAIYLSGEESPAQIKLRADRLKLKTENIFITDGADISGLENILDEIKPKILVVDSIQTVYDSRISGSAGSQMQVKESGLVLQQLAKKYNVAVIIIGHVTKEGLVAGPRTLEHLVDVVVYLEGERNRDARILRTVKNRFGTTDEIAVLVMSETGLKEITNPGAIFLSETENAPGSAICVLLEGTRPLLVEIQALTTPTSFGYPRRTSSGFDLNRLNILVGVLIKRAGLNLGGQDIYLNVVGGISANEPAADLAVCLAIASSMKNKTLPKMSAFFAEVGLTGELRNVAGADKRKKEAKNLGYTPLTNFKNVREAIDKTLV
ncbi:MAG: DNA repair protein RadA [Candidatus Berkelbacteria bacterium]|nr:DNA repair protein RadA [Candidatus Berkelbacteria bacterium]